MPFLVYRLSRFLRQRLRGWRLPLAVAAFVFLSSWLGMALVEPAGSEIVLPGTYWWYFVVTSATVGYGDFFPTSTGGRIVGLWEYDPEREDIAWTSFVRPDAALRAEVERTATMIREHLGDARSFSLDSLDSPESRKPRIAALRAGS